MATSDRPGTDLAKGIGVMFVTSVLIGILILAGAPAWITLAVGLLWLLGGAIVVLAIAQVLNQVSRK